LLVVIGIIAVLIGILLPALNKARKAAKTTQCLSNVRQLAMGALQYWNDNKGKFSPYYDFGGVPPAPFQIEWFQQFAKPEQFNKVRLCPEAPEPNPALMPNPLPTGTTAGPNMFGSAIYCWGPYGQAMRYFDDKGNTQHMAGSYTFNGYLLKSDISGDDTGLAKSNNASNLKWLWVPPVKRGSNVPVISDGTWPSAWVKESEDITQSGDNGVPNLYNPADNGSGGLDINKNNWRRVMVARHYMAINVSFMDGHASTIPLPDLWLYE